MSVTAVTSRRGFLSAVAAAAVLPAAAVPQPIDPIFAIVVRCRAAFDEFGAASLACDKVEADSLSQHITDAARDRLESADDELGDATDLLAATVPTTMDGLAAAVAWLLEYDECCIPETSGRFLRTLARSPLLAGG